MFLSRFSVSEDGNTLTSDASTVSGKESTKAVYERQ